MSIIPRINPNIKLNTCLNIPITEDIKKQLKDLYYLDEANYNIIANYCHTNRIFDNPNSIDIINFMYHMLHYLNDQSIDLTVRETAYKLVNTLGDTYNAFIQQNIDTKDNYICFKRVTLNKEMCTEHYKYLIDTTLKPMQQAIINNLNTFCDKYSLWYDMSTVYILLDELLDSCCTLITFQLVQTKEYILNNNISFSTYEEKDQRAIESSIFCIIDNLIYCLLTSIVQLTPTEHIRESDITQDMKLDIEDFKKLVYNYIIDNIDNIILYAYNLDIISHMLFATFIVTDKSQNTIEKIDECLNTLKGNFNVFNDVELQNNCAQSETCLESDTVDIDNEEARVDNSTNTSVNQEYNNVMSDRDRYNKSPINNKLIDNIPPNFIANLLKES